MPLLIDGYNLMWGAGIVGDVRGPRGFERSRAALIGFVARAVDDAQRSGTTIVFDAAGAPPGLPATFDYDGILVRFARGYADADALLEEIIEKHHTPRRLTVVSSDHRVQRAAKRRKCEAVDSEVWFDAALRRFHERASGSRGEDAAKPNAAGAPGEVGFWIKRIAGDAEIERALANWDDVAPLRPKRAAEADAKKPDAKKKKKPRL